MCFFGLFYLEKMIKFAELLRTDMIKGAALATPFFIFCPFILEAYRRISVEPSLPSCTA